MRFFSKVAEISNSTANILPNNGKIQARIFEQDQFKLNHREKNKLKLKTF
jgi:hypothetical protein